MTERTYRIGEAASLLNLKTYVLRFWETEFPQLVPLRTEKGQRLYTEADLALLRRIRLLLHERGLTIEGARRMLAERGAPSGSSMPDAPDMPDAAGGGMGGLVGFGDDDPDDMALGGAPGHDDASADADADAEADAEPDADDDISGPQGHPLSAAASRVQAWDQYLHGLLLPDDGKSAPADARGGQAAQAGPADGGTATTCSGGAAPGTVREIIAELEAMRRLLAGAD